MAKASFGIEYECSLPSIGDCIELLEARNPIMSILSQNPIPVDIILKEKKGLVLTGPNTGGKTVFLKTLGLSYIMFLHAIPIPASPNSKLPIFDNIFVDIGDEQDISQSLSTFSSHIKNISEILQRSTEKTLILIDELGAGTDPLEGSALGIAILDYIKKLGSFVVVSTHHTPIKLWAVNSDYYEPATLMFDRDTLRPLYKVLYGTIGESMGIEVAKRFGIPKEVILEAQKLLGENTLEYQGVMENLNRLVRDTKIKWKYWENIEKSLSF
jgi:Mismatch repair ATPase (MutS family)